MRFKSFMLLVIIQVIIQASGCGPGTPPRAPTSSTKSLDGSGDPGKDGSPDGPVVDPNQLSEAQKAQLELLRQVLPSCGVTNIDSYKAEKLAEQSIESAPWQRKGKGGLLGGQEYNYSLGGSFGVDATFERIINSATISLKSSSSAVGQDRGSQEARARSGSVTATLYPLASRHELKAAAPIWNDVYCTAQAAARLTNEAGGKKVVSEFNPPLPYWISPKADLARFALELGATKSWDQIKATVTESTEQGISPGSVFTGSVRIDQVDTAASLIGRSGAVVTVQSEIAYKITYIFEAGAKNAAIGLPTSVTYYMDLTSNKFKAVVWTTAGEDSVTISQVSEN